MFYGLNVREQIGESESRGEKMSGKLVLAVGLVMDGVGMILRLSVLQSVGLLRGNRPPIVRAIVPQGTSFSGFTGLVTVPKGVLVGFEFLLPAFGILYPSARC